MNTSNLSYRKLIIIYALWLLWWVAFHTWILYRMGFSLEISWADSAVNNLLLAAVCFGLTNLLKYYQPWKKGWIHLLVWSFALTGSWLWGVNKLLIEFYGDNSTYLLFLEQSLPVRFFIAFLLINSGILLSWVWHNMKNQHENEAHKVETEKIAREAELAGLRQQLQPHFLFNSLNSISALAGSRPEEARKMIQQLSDFLRGTLKKNEQQLVNLEEELQHLQLYLEIEKVRFGHRLSTLIETDELSRKQILPPLLLQPIVENAIKFGLYDTIGEITIRIKATTENHHLIISVENPFDPATSQPRQGTGFGLNSVARRLYLLFGRNDLLQTQIKENLFITIIKIPQAV